MRPHNFTLGDHWESNPGPLAPKARIIPLDYSPKKNSLKDKKQLVYFMYFYWYFIPTRTKY
jgi:hypothetical protein